MNVRPCTHAVYYVALCTCAYLWTYARMDYQGHVCAHGNIRASGNRTRARVNRDAYVRVCTSVNIHALSVSDHVTGNVFLADSRRS